MSMENYQQAIAIISANQQINHFIGTRSENLLLAAERAIGFPFPPIYRRFLSDFGAGNFGYIEIYGVIDDDFENSSIPDGVWFTLTERVQNEFPVNYFIFSETGSGEFYCFELNEQAYDTPIFIYEPGIPLKHQKMEKVANDFGEFLLYKIQQVVENGTE